VLLPQAQAQPLPQNPDEELAAARAAIRQNVTQMNAVKLAMDVEPAVHFKP